MGTDGGKGIGLESRTVNSRCMLRRLLRSLTKVSHWETEKADREGARRVLYRRRVRRPALTQCKLRIGRSLGMPVFRTQKKSAVAKIATAFSFVKNDTAEV